MTSIKLDSILLFALVIPFIMMFRLGPSDTPYWLFGIIFLGLAVNIFLDIINIKLNLYNKLKNVLLWFIIIVVLGSAFGSAIVVRHRTHPVYMIHDMPLQQEIAIRFLLDGKNPYSTSYLGTFLEQWNYSDKEKNPALYHFVLPPLYIIFALPFYFISNRVFGFFDARIPIVFLLFVILYVAISLIKDHLNKRLFLILLAFNPAILPYTLEGRSDIFMYAFLFAGFFFLYKNRYSLSSISNALAFSVKQSAWPLLPFYVAFLYFKTKSIAKVIKILTPFIIVISVINLPFLIWDKKSFTDSTIGYLSGMVEHSYPISGYGWGKILQQMGLIKDINAYYPFYIWQIIVGIPLIIFLIKYLSKTLGVGRLILVYGIFLLFFWYFSRYFNNSHLGYLSLVFVTAYFWPKKSESESK